MDKLRRSAWNFGILYWTFNIFAQGNTFLADGSLGKNELLHLITTSLLFFGWLCVKPESLESASLKAEGISTLKYYRLDATLPPHEVYLRKTEDRMLQIAKYHLISQEYTLPVPYLCQIYHLLNLKHLESIHAFSLNGLKIIDVSQFQPTDIGGAIKFQTVLDSPLNLLRIWRQPITEVELTLHTPYTVELSIPIYGGKTIAVMFNVLPLSDNHHKLFIDIYSNVIFPRLPLQVFLHLASSLTLLEDVPYLRRLAQGRIHRSDRDKSHSPSTMLLFDRFADLYGSGLEQPQPTGAVELRPV